MKKYVHPKIEINHFLSIISATDTPVTASADYMYAAEMANSYTFGKYLSNRATTTKIQDVMDFK